MKNTIYALAVLFAFASQSSAQEQKGDKHYYQLSLTGNYGMWNSGDVSNKGDQGQVFGQIAYSGDEYGSSVTGRWAKTHYQTTHSDDALDLATLVDTNIATYYTSNLGGMAFRGGIDFDIPSGKHAYTNSELGRIITDPVSSDVMILNSYGGGLNVAPHFVATYPFSKATSLGFGARYIFTGEYDPTSEIDSDNLDPGDRLMALVNGANAFSDQDIATLMLVYIHAGSDRQDGREIFNTGDTFVAEARYIRQWSADLRAILAVTYQTQGKNSALAETGVLNSELQNSNNNSLEAYLNSQYKINDIFTLTGMVGYKSVNANGYSPDDALYEGGRNKYYVEPGFTMVVSRYFYSTLKFRHSKVMDKKDAFSTVDTAYDVWNVDLAMVMSF